MVPVGIYTEDGNEMNNGFLSNVIICKNPTTCGWSGNEWQEESGIKEGGILWHGMTNNAVRNRVAGHWHGMRTKPIGNGKGWGVHNSLTPRVIKIQPLGVITGQSV